MHDDQLDDLLRAAAENVRAGHDDPAIVLEAMKPGMRRARQVRRGRVGAALATLCLVGVGAILTLGDPNEGSTIEASGPGALPTEAAAATETPAVDPTATPVELFTVPWHGPAGDIVVTHDGLSIVDPLRVEPADGVDGTVIDRQATSVRIRFTGALRTDVVITLVNRRLAFDEHPSESDSDDGGDDSAGHDDGRGDVGSDDQGRTAGDDSDAGGDPDGVDDPDDDDAADDPHEPDGPDEADDPEEPDEPGDGHLEKVGDD